MPRAPTPLTDTEIKQAKPRAKEYTLWDGQGLCLRVKPSGAKSWIFSYYRPYTRQRANLSFGIYPTSTLAKARLERQQALELLSQQIDPQTHRNDQQQQQALAQNNTLAAVAKQWIDVKRSKITEAHATDSLRSLELHLFPKLGNHPIHTLRARDVIHALKPIAAKGSHETVKRLCQRLNEIMVYAVNTGLLETNPLAGIGKAFEAPAKVNMPTLKPERLPELMQSVANASIKLITRYLIEWQLHTMTRPSEAAGTRWDEIDFDKQLWTIPAERMKKRRAHVVPLSSQALRLLERIKPISCHREHVFPADRNPRSHANQQTANMALKRMGFGGELVAHGLRALASTTLNEQGFDADVIEAALAHTDKNSVRAAYNRADYIKRRRVMMQWWSDHIEQASFGNLSVTGRKQLRVVN
jgi:integrase